MSTRSNLIKVVVGYIDTTLKYKLCLTLSVTVVSVWDKLDNHPKFQF